MPEPSHATEPGRDILSAVWIVRRGDGGRLVVARDADPSRVREAAALWGSVNKWKGLAEDGGPPIDEHSHPSLELWLVQSDGGAALVVAATRDRRETLPYEDLLAMPGRLDLLEPPVPLQVTPPHGRPASGERWSQRRA